MVPAPKLLRPEAEKSAKNKSSKKLPKSLRPEAEKWRPHQKSLRPEAESSAFSKRPKLLYQTIQSVVHAESEQVSCCWDQEIFAFCKSSSRHFNGWVLTSSAKVFFQEIPARYRTLASRQNEYLPQVSGRVEGR
jgi:hypothetical protein